MSTYTATVRWSGDDPEAYAKGRNKQIENPWKNHDNIPL